jgi:hypothetical protein
MSADHGVDRVSNAKRHISLPRKRRKEGRKEGIHVALQWTPRGVRRKEGLPTASREGRKEGRKEGRAADCKQRRKEGRKEGDQRRVLDFLYSVIPAEGRKK